MKISAYTAFAIFITLVMCAYEIFKLSKPQIKAAPLEPVTVEMSIDGAVRYAELQNGETLHIIFDNGKLQDIQFLEHQTQTQD